VVDRNHSSECILKEEPGSFSKATIQEYVSDIKTKHPGGVHFLGSYVGIAGMIKFVKGYYLVLISNGEEAGQLGEHIIFSSKGGVMIPLFDTGESPSVVDSGFPSALSKGWASFFNGHQEPINQLEEEYENLFNLVDMSKAFYWSYTYNISQSLQRNIAQSVRTFCGESSNQSDRFVWNTYIANEFIKVFPRESNMFENRWIISLMHGSFRQQKCSVLSRSFTVTLIGRRSRHFAGTRFLKRGINDDGFVANDVEIEQVFQDHSLISSANGSISAFLQVRGSIPTFWTQEVSVSVPKPPIKMTRFDPFYMATKRHFADLMRRYGSSIIALNLVKLKEKFHTRREVIVGKNYKQAVGQLDVWLPDSLGIDYRAVDFTRLSKLDPSSLMLALDSVAIEALQSSSIFISCGLALTGTNDPTITRNLELSRADLLNRHHKFVQKRMAPKRPLRWSASKNHFKPMKMITLGRNLASDVKTFRLRKKSSASARDKLSLSPSTRTVQHQYLDVDNFNEDGEDSEPDDDEVSVSSVDADEDEPEHVIRDVVSKGGLFRKCTFKGLPKKDSFIGGIQTGVVRTNCIDCLDRTNLAQFLIGLRALNLQLQNANIISQEERLETDSPISSVLMDLYEDLGDKISHQYGGSDAVKKAGKVMSNSVGSSRQQAVYTALKRYYTNNFTDHAKQDGINVFLGVLRPENRKSEDHEVKGDYYLHNKNVTIAPNKYMNVPYGSNDEWWSDACREFIRDVSGPLSALSHASLTRNLSHSVPKLHSWSTRMSNTELPSLLRLNDEDSSVSSSFRCIEGLLAEGLVHHTPEVLETYLEVGVVDRSNDPVLQEYVHQEIDPFSMFEFSETKYLNEERECQKVEFTKALDNYLITEDDGWGMRRLQAYSCATMNLLQGQYKGFPHSLPAVSVMSQAYDGFSSTNT